MDLLSAVVPHPDLDADPGVIGPNPLQTFEREPRNAKAPNQGVVPLAQIKRVGWRVYANHFVSPIIIWRLQTWSPDPVARKMD